MTNSIWIFLRLLSSRISHPDLVIENQVGRGYDRNKLAELMTIPDDPGVIPICPVCGELNCAHERFEITVSQ